MLTNSQNSTQQKQKLSETQKNHIQCKEVSLTNLHTYICQHLKTRKTEHCLIQQYKPRFDFFLSVCTLWAEVSGASTGILLRQQECLVFLYYHFSRRAASPKPLTTTMWAEYLFPECVTHDFSSTNALAILVHWAFRPSQSLSHTPDCDKT